MEGVEEYGVEAYLDLKDCGFLCFVDTGVGIEDIIGGGAKTGTGGSEVCGCDDAAAGAAAGGCCWYRGCCGGATGVSGGPLAIAFQSNALAIAVGFLVKDSLKVSVEVSACSGRLREKKSNLLTITG